MSQFFTPRVAEARLRKIKILQWVVFLVVASVIVAFGVFRVRHYRGFQAKLEESYDAREAVVEHTASGKIALTKDLLTCDYESYHAARVEAGGIVGTFLGVILSIALLFLILCAIGTFARGYITGEVLNRRKLSTHFILLAVTAVIFVLVLYNSFTDTGPDPDGAAFRVETVDYVSRYSQRFHKKKHYYVYYKVNGEKLRKEVSVFEYNLYPEEPGQYYVAIAMNGSKSVEFMLYSPSEYERTYEA